MHLPRSSIVRASGAAAALALACAPTACGGDDPVGAAMAQQTVTVQLQPAPSVSSAPVQPQQAPAAPSGGATSATAPPAAAAPAPARAPARRAGASAPAAAPRPQPTVHLLRATALRDAPGGRAIGRLQPLTEFRSPTVLAVVRQRGSWLGVLAPALPNGKVGWISARAAYEVHRSGWSVHASLRDRVVVVRRDGRVVQRFPVAIGGESTPTPTGRFAVTDKLLTSSASSPYGCCILALTGHQTSTPQGWGGGDRIAIHATNLPETIGTRASAGCLRAPTDAIRRVVNTVPLGTVVTISA